MSGMCFYDIKGKDTVIKSLYYYLCKKHMYLMCQCNCNIKKENYGTRKTSNDEV